MTKNCIKIQRKSIPATPKRGPAIEPHIVSANHMGESGRKTKAFLISERNRKQITNRYFIQKWDVSTSVKSSMSQFINSGHMWGVPSEAIIHQWVQGTTKQTDHARAFPYREPSKLTSLRPLSKQTLNLRRNGWEKKLN